MDRLTALIGEGPDRRYTMKAVVLSRYEDIVSARALMRTWRDIGDALGFEGRGKDVAGCFARVDAAIKCGKLKQPQKAQIKAVQAARTGDVSRSGRINIDDPANQL